jgi:hypothetical protein
MQFFAGQVRVPASSPYERDPRRLPRVSVTQAKIGGDGYGAANYYAALDAIGDYQSASPFTATRTIVNVTGRGSLLGCIGPAITAAGASTTWTITVDGVAYTITHVHGDAGSTRQSVIGAILAIPEIYTTAGASGGAIASTDFIARNGDDTSLKQAPANFMQIKSPEQVERVIVFDTSLRIDVACSVAPYEPRCGAIWHLDT